MYFRRASRKARTNLCIARDGSRLSERSLINTVYAIFQPTFRKVFWGLQNIPSSPDLFFATSSNPKCSFLSTQQPLVLPSRHSVANSTWAMPHPQSPAPAAHHFFLDDCYSHLPPRNQHTHSLYSWQSSSLSLLFPSLFPLAASCCSQSCCSSYSMSSTPSL